MEKKTKLNWKNIGKVIVFILCFGFILYDLYMLFVYPFITGRLVGFTLIGFITFVAALWILVAIYQDFDEQTKNVPNTGTVRHNNK